MFGDHWCKTSQHSHFMLVYECWPRCTFRLRMKAADSNFIKFLWAFPDRWSKSPLHVTVLSYAMQTTIPRKKTTRHKVHCSSCFFILYAGKFETVWNVSPHVSPTSSVSKASAQQKQTVFVCTTHTPHHTLNQCPETITAFTSEFSPQTS